MCCGPAAHAIVTRHGRDPEPHHHQDTSEVEGDMQVCLEGVRSPSRICWRIGELMLNFLALESWSLHHLYACTRTCEQMTWHWQKH